MVEAVLATIVAKLDTWYVFSLVRVNIVLMIVTRLYRGPCPRLLPR